MGQAHPVAVEARRRDTGRIASGCRNALYKLVARPWRQGCVDAGHRSVVLPLALGNHGRRQEEPPRRPFNGELAGRLGALAEDLKTGFLVFCNHAPGLAAAYLEALKQQPFPDRVREEILKFRGSLAQAAPKELAELTAEVLIPTEEEEEEYRRGPMPDPFGHADLKFVPASPAQGPFLELLVHAPQHGLPLIRRLVDHAVKFFTRGRDFGQNAMTIAFPDGSKIVFPWYQMYNWSREAGSGTPVLASALMALEAWSHNVSKPGSQ